MNEGMKNEDWMNEWMDEWRKIECVNEDWMNAWIDEERLNE